MGTIVCIIIAIAFIGSISRFDELRQELKGGKEGQQLNEESMKENGTDNVPFVKAVLDSFFDAKEEVRNNYQKINASQMEEQKNRRPVGFATSNP